MYVGATTGADDVGAILGTCDAAITGAFVGVRVGANVGAFDTLTLDGAIVGETPGAFVVTVNELLVHCRFVSAAVRPHDDVPDAYELLL